MRKGIYDMADRHRTEGIVLIDEKTLKDRIHVIRGKEVMLDFDLAEIYGYTTKAFNQQVQRNMDRFPEDFMFQLNETETGNLRSQIVTSSWGGSRYHPYAFTEQGIYMLMTVLRGESAVKQSKALIRLFKQMKDYIAATEQSSSFELYRLLKSSYQDLDLRVSALEHLAGTYPAAEEIAHINELIANDLDQGSILLYQGEWRKADHVLSEIFASAVHSICIIDPYVGKKTLDHLAGIRKDVPVLILTKNVKELPESYYRDHLLEHPRTEIRKISRNYDHDRFIMIDRDHPKREKIYGIGTSLKDTGKSLTVITELKDLHPFLCGIIDECMKNGLFYEAV